MNEVDLTPSHVERASRHYTLHFPEHAPRTADPHYRDFEAVRRRTQAEAACAYASLGECAGVLELHHSHIEFALLNAVDLRLLERDYPGVSNPDELGAWVESAPNLQWLCEWHHRGHGGVHVAASADFEASHYIHGLIT